MCRDEDTVYFNFEVTLKSSGDNWIVSAKKGETKNKKSVNTLQQAVVAEYGAEPNPVAIELDVAPFANKDLYHHISSERVDFTVSYPIIVGSCGATGGCDKIRTELINKHEKKANIQFSEPAQYAANNIRHFTEALAIIYTPEDNPDWLATVATQARGALDGRDGTSEIATSYPKRTSHYVQIDLIFNTVKREAGQAKNLGQDAGGPFHLTIDDQSKSVRATVASENTPAQDKIQLIVKKFKELNIFQGQETNFAQHVHELRVWTTGLRVLHYVHQNNPVLVAYAGGIFGVGDFVRDPTTSAAMGVNHGHAMAKQLATSLEQATIAEAGTNYQAAMGPLATGLIKSMYAASKGQAEK